MVLADRSRRKVLAEHPERFHAAEAFGEDRTAKAVEIGLGPGAVERGRVEAHAFERVLDYGLGDTLHGRVEAVHAGTVGLIRGCGHLFFQTGGRFSMKLTMPSRPSSVAAFIAIASIANEYAFG